MEPGLTATPARPTFLPACLLVLALLSGGAQARDPEEAARLLQTGRAAEALKVVDGLLARQADDVQLRFLRGVALAELNRAPEAILVFNKLIQDHPELPEPYNNLAVLYANQGQYDRARAALESAIRTNPSYATAHENLGDLYAKMASQAYAKALQLDAGNTRAAPKLAMIRKLISTKGPMVPAESGRAAEAAAPEAPPASPPVALPVPAVAAVAAAEPAEARPASRAERGQAMQSEAAVRAAVEAWAAAWSRRDVDAYLAAYTPDHAADGMDRAAWEASRRERIEGKKSISVKLDQLKVQVRGDQATVSFRQEYAADTLRVKSRKQLKLVLVDGAWRIQRETSV